ncbi:hypothetical protein IR155_07600 [Microbacterium paludicola]|uniref:hypothetical protein n=1 Tax=Microbacterium paludicola TaxID=300019 RepID=UPI00188404AB|nr:hypothetical protein [Microbacterium paludicola]MBF0816266.1 hypothetical protein [Microbacterium paludicola]
MTNTPAEDDERDLQSSEEADQTPVTVSDPVPAPERVRAPRAAKERPVTPMKPATDETRKKESMSVELSAPESLSARIREFKSSTKVSMPTLVLDAVEATVDDLPQLIAERLGVQHPKAAQRKLFDRPAPTVRISSRDEKTEAYPMRMRTDHVAVLDQLKDEVGAPSRNLLMVVALDAYLPGGDDES